MKYMWILLVLFVVIVPTVSAIRRYKSLTYNADLENRLKELQALAEQEKAAREKQKPAQPEEPKQAS